MAKKGDDTTGITDAVEVVKGPAADVWGDEHASTPPTTLGTEPQPFTLEEGAKGPDPEVWGEEHASFAQPGE